MPHFTELTDLADERAGGVVLMANDDFFAEKENLLRHAEPIWIGDRYTDRGKWMDGWESRRRRTSGHDFCVLRLGLPGVIRGVDINTAFFKGNFPEFAAIDACAAPAEAPLELLGSKDAPWFPLVAKTPLLGDAHNLVPVSSGQRWTHLRLQIFPDGGVARLRVHGEVIPDWDALHARNELVDLCALQHGGRVIASNDAFFGSHENLLLPGRAGSMKDGWETRRKRRPGHDWVILQLGARGAIESVQVDTNHFKGNYPDRCSLEVLDAPGATLETLTDPRAAWLPLLPETRLSAHTLHSFARELGKPGPGDPRAPQDLSRWRRQSPAPVGAPQPAAGLAGAPQPGRDRRRRRGAAAPVWLAALGRGGRRRAPLRQPGRAAARRRARLRRARAR